MNRYQAANSAKLMMDAALFMSAVSHLVSENNTDRDCGEKEFLSIFHLDGLMKGMEVVARSLCIESEKLSEEVEKEEEEALKAREKSSKGKMKQPGAVLAHRSGKATLDGTNVRAQS